ncbi:Histone-lysine N-methyltransferase, H3 lysine-36 specific [Hanseniaspora osmophila]|uniref:Histone-lysine N-methyltransferase, H3 lysine-36 specific n=1 Tax=Hanseniaspora osmophila TaxID=56408 RepID=A0A1E5RH25_9ASCO|nr:Histone-lysine N-methyltransferase, H3 lysine-36 specific [Hanseniaspora osmophila]
MPFVSYIDLENKTKEACQKFQQIDECTYSREGLGRGRRFEEFMECDCSDDWKDGSNKACAENSDCINRLTQIECVNGRCSQCGRDCENQRFQKKQYSDISIIQTEKKGYGVIAQKQIPAQQFIIEYIGEVITEKEFNQRMIDYDLDTEKRKHFYFMMLQKGEFIDATTKGCIARFCNHSCNPNAYVSKWVVKGKLRMGIFAERDIQRGEEITFDYNVDRYGAKAQKCYCGEPNCIGVLGGKVQTDTTNLLPDVFLSALGSSRSAEKKFRQSFKSNKENKKLEIDEEGINKDFLKTLTMEPMHDKDQVSKVVAALLQTRSKALCMKLIQRVMLTKDETLKLEMVKLHGYSAISNVLDVLRAKERYVKIILKYLLTLPRTFRDTIVSSRIDKLVKELGNRYELGEVLDPQIADSAKKLLEKWSTFEVYKRIQKIQTSKGAAPNPAAVSRRQERKQERLNDTKRYTDAAQTLLPHPGNIFSASPIPDRKQVSSAQLLQQGHFTKTKSVSHETTPRTDAFNAGVLKPDAENSVGIGIAENGYLSTQSKFLNNKQEPLSENMIDPLQASLEQTVATKSATPQIEKNQIFSKSAETSQIQTLPPVKTENTELPFLKDLHAKHPVGLSMERTLLSADGTFQKKNLSLDQLEEKFTTPQFDGNAVSAVSPVLAGPNQNATKLTEKRFQAEPLNMSKHSAQPQALPPTSAHALQSPQPYSMNKGIRHMERFQSSPANNPRSPLHDSFSLANENKRHIQSPSTQSNAPNPQLCINQTASQPSTSPFVHAERKPQFAQLDQRQLHRPYNGMSTSRFGPHSSPSSSNRPLQSRFNNKPSRFSNSYKSSDATPNQFNGRKRFIDHDDRQEKDFSSRKFSRDSPTPSQYVPLSKSNEQSRFFHPKPFLRDNRFRDRSENTSGPMPPTNKSADSGVKSFPAGPNSKAGKGVPAKVTVSAATNQPPASVKTQGSLGALTPPYTVKNCSNSWKDNGSRSSSNGGSSSRMNNKTPVEIAESKWKHFFSGFVPNVIFREFSTQKLPHSVCKKIIREFIHSLTDKEIQQNHFDPPVELTANYKKSIMDTAAIYVKKKNTRIMKYARDAENGH